MHRAATSRAHPAASSKGLRRAERPPGCRLSAALLSRGPPLAPNRLQEIYAAFEQIYPVLQEFRKTAEPVAGTAA